MSISWNNTKTVGKTKSGLVFKIVKQKGHISRDLYMGDAIIKQHAEREVLNEYADDMAAYA